MASYRKNIIRLYVVKLSKWFNLVMPVVVLFYQDNGLGMQEIFILKSIYSLSVVGLEVPSGWIADVWGRKKTLILGSVLGSAGILMYSFSYGFWAFAFAEVVLGAGFSFISGADSAMLYDSLKAQNRQGEYVKHEGQITSAGNFAEAIAGIAAGFLAAISLRYPFYFQFVVTSLAIPATLTLTETVVPKATHVHSIKKFVLEIKSTFISLPNLRTAVLLSAITGAATLTFAWLVQPFLKEIKLPVEYFGIVWTALNLSVGLSSAFAFVLEGKMDRRKEMMLITILLSAGYLLSGIMIHPAGLIFLFLFYLARGLATPIFKNYVNQVAPGEMLATILSVRNLIIRIIFAIFGPLLGWVTDFVSLNHAFILAGLFYFFSILMIIRPWQKANKGQPFIKINPEK